jgi:hypothetical protein
LILSEFIQLRTGNFTFDWIDVGALVLGFTLSSLFLKFHFEKNK